MLRARYCLQEQDWRMSASWECDARCRDACGERAGLWWVCSATGESAFTIQALDSLAVRMKREKICEDGTNLLIKLQHIYEELMQCWDLQKNETQLSLKDDKERWCFCTLNTFIILCAVVTLSITRKHVGLVSRYKKDVCCFPQAEHQPNDSSIVDVCCRIHTCFCDKERLLLRMEQCI